MFCKFPKIEEVFSAEELQAKIKGRYYIQEKIDGSNIGIYIEPDKEPVFYTRNGAPFDAYGFDKYREYFIERFKPVIELIKEPIYLHGEYYGKGILNRIHYDDYRNHIRIFAMRVLIKDPKDDVDNLLGTGKILAPEIMLNFFCMSCPEVMDFFVTHWVNRDTFLLPDICRFPKKSGFGNDNREGYVIYDTKAGLVTNIYKYKDPRFKDKKPFNLQVLDENGVELHKAFLGYLTKNRMLDTLSKFGGKGETKVILSAFIKDAKEDFAKDFDVSGLTKEQTKVVLNGGSTPYQLYKQCMDEIKEGE